jgi:hypothetical protein
MLAVQKEWLEQLARFVSKYAKADESADALLQLGMINELQANEDDAKKWYTQLAGGAFRSKPEGVKATGALRRLNVEGKPWELNAQVAALGGGAFSMDRLRGKTVIVYYWARWCDSAPADFAVLKKVLQTYQSKGLEVVTISLDDARPEAESFIKQHNPPGIHLYAGGGFEGPVASHYGLIALPHLFIVDKEGKVIDRAAQAAGLEVDLKKIAK